MSNNKQAGFAMVLAVTVALIGIAIIGLVIWRQNQLSKPMIGATSSNTAISQSTKETTTAATVTPAGNYLDIKELGVKILLNDQISDAVYSIVPTNDGSKGVGISAKSLIDKSASCSASNFTLGLVEATTTQPTKVGGAPSAVDNKSIFKIGNYYIWYRQPQNEGCVTTTGQPNTALASAIASKLNAFEQAFTTVQPDN